MDELKKIIAEAIRQSLERQGVAMERLNVSIKDIASDVAEAVQEYLIKKE